MSHPSWRIYAPSSLPLTEGGHKAFGFQLFEGEGFWMWEAF
jgi:hypothetical protein